MMVSIFKMMEPFCGGGGLLERNTAPGHQSGISLEEKIDPTYRACAVHIRSRGKLVA